MSPADSLIWAVVAAAASWLTVSTVVPASLRGLVSVGRRVEPLSRPIAATVAVLLLSVALRPSPTGAVVPPPDDRVIVDADGSVTGEPVRNPMTLRATNVVSASYTVVPGDTLWSIARGVLTGRGGDVSGADVATFWQEIYAVNTEVIGHDPNLILPGQVLTIPGGVHG